MERSIQFRSNLHSKFKEQKQVECGIKSSTQSQRSTGWRPLQHWRRVEQWLPFLWWRYCQSADYRSQLSWRIRKSLDKQCRMQHGHLERQQRRLLPQKFQSISAIMWRVVLLSCRIPAITTIKRELAVRCRRQLHLAWPVNIIWVGAKCSGTVAPCLYFTSPSCRNPNTDLNSCLQGKGKCYGYSFPGSCSCINYKRLPGGTLKPFILSYDR